MQNGIECGGESGLADMAMSGLGHTENKANRGQSQPTKRGRSGLAPRAAADNVLASRMGEDLGGSVPDTTSKPDDSAPRNSNTT